MRMTNNHEVYDYLLWHTLNNEKQCLMVGSISGCKTVATDHYKEKNLKADFVIANPLFNDSDWSGDLLRKDGRWKYMSARLSGLGYSSLIFISY